MHPFVQYSASIVPRPSTSARFYPQSLNFQEKQSAMGFCLLLAQFYTTNTTWFSSSVSQSHTRGNNFKSSNKSWKSQLLASQGNSLRDLILGIDLIPADLITLWKLLYE